MASFFILIPFLLGLGQFARVSLAYGVRFYVVEVAMGVFLLLSISRYTLAPLKAAQKYPLLLAWVGWMLFGWLMTCIGSTMIDDARALFYIIRIVVLMACAVYIPYYYQLIRRSWICYVLIPIVCMIQYIILPDLRFMSQYGWDPHMYRAVGTILDPPIVGAVLGVIWLHALSRLVTKGDGACPRLYSHGSRNALKKLREIGHWILNFCLKLDIGQWTLIFTYVSIIFLFSRSTYISLLLVTAAYLVMRKKYLSAGIFVLVTLVCIYVAPLTISIHSTLESAKIERTSTVTSRFTEMRDGAKVWLTSPIYGIGYDRVSEYKAHHESPTAGEDNHAASAYHSFWVTQLATTGVVGLLLLLGGLWQLCRRHPRLIYPIVWIAIIGVFDNVVFHPFVVVTLLMLYAGREVRG